MANDKKRFVYIDLLRGWAVLVMVEVHVVNAFLLPEIREEGWFPVLNFINGLVAPSFLFIAGYAFTLVGQRKWNDYLTGSRVLWKQIGRILQVWIVGYALHLPTFSLEKLVLLDVKGWEAFWRIDVLQTIAASLAVLLLLVLLARRQKVYFAVVSLLTLSVVFLSPLVYHRDLVPAVPLPVADYLTAAYHSLFPLFPWMAFVLAGAVTAQFVVWRSDAGNETTAFRSIAVAGGVMIIAALISTVVPVSLYPAHDFWRSGPAYFFIRLGVVLLLLSGLWLWERRMRSGRSVVSVVGSESLVAYAGHLLVIYGVFYRDTSLAGLIGATRSPWEVAVMTAVLITATAAVSYVWHRMKNWSMFYARIFQYSLLMIVLYVFLTNPG